MKKNNKTIVISRGIGILMTLVMLVMALQVNPAPAKAATQYANILDGLYYIKTSEGLAFDVKDFGKKNRTNLQIYKFNGTENQVFRFTRQWDGSYIISCDYSGLVIDLSGAIIKNGRNIQVYESNGTAAQRWYIRNNNDGTFTFESSINSGYVMDVKSKAVGKNNANIHLWSYHGDFNQRFILECIEHESCLPDFAKETFTNPESSRTSYGSTQRVATWNDYEGGSLSCTYYTLRKLRERGLGFPFKSPSGANGAKWYSNSVSDYKEEGVNCLETLMKKYGDSIALYNIVVSFRDNRQGAGHVLLIDRLYYDKNTGNLMVEYSDQVGAFGFPVIHDANGTNKARTFTVETFFENYKGLNLTCNGAVLIGKY